MQLFRILAWQTFQRENLMRKPNNLNLENFSCTQSACSFEINLDAFVRKFGICVDVIKRSSDWLKSIYFHMNFMHIDVTRILRRQFYKCVSIEYPGPHCYSKFVFLYTKFNSQTIAKRATTTKMDRISRMIPSSANNHPLYELRFC